MSKKVAPAAVIMMMDYDQICEIVRTYYNFSPDTQIEIDLIDDLNSMAERDEAELV